MTQESSSSGTCTPHVWRFNRVGGFDMVRLETAEDLRCIGQLDQKLWAALACPVKGLQLDEKTLAMIDTDGDGRVRAPEVIEAVEWTCRSLHDPARIMKDEDTLALSNIADQILLDSARQILSSLGKADAEMLALEDVSDVARIFAQTTFNGDGVIIPESAGSDEETARLIREIISTQGAIKDRSGKDGVNMAKLVSFFSELEAFDAWTREAEINTSTILPLGDRTAAAAAALEAVRAKLDDFFGRCQLAAFDPRAITALNRQESEFLEVAAKDLSVTAGEIRAFPIARVEPGRPLPLKDGVNPAWRDAVSLFAETVVHPLLGRDKDALTQEEWAELKARFAPFEAWSAAKKGTSIESLGIDRIRSLMTNDGRARVSALIARDLELEPKFTAISNVERLVRYNRDLFRLLQNFVNLNDFYNPSRMAVFQTGTLYLDSRACHLVVRVRDAAKHAALAGLSRAYLTYLDCTRPGTNETLQIVAAFTNGDSDYLMVGRNGLFYDRDGRDWDATITRVIENPISIRQAFWSPYKKFIRFIEDQVAKRAAAADAEADRKLAELAKITTSAEEKPRREPTKIDVGTVAALGVAVSGMVAVITGIVSAIVGLGPWIPVAIIGVLLFISGPSMLIAALKLRQRNLGPILDANGWAINGRVRINIPFGRSLTDIAKLPPGSRRTIKVTFRDKRKAWVILAIIAAILAAVWIRWDRIQRGHYFWQPPPATTTTPPDHLAAEKQPVKNQN